MDSLLIILLIILLLLGCFLAFNRYRDYQYFKERGIPTPPFNFLFGHLLKMWSADSFAHQLQKWTVQHGKIYGIFAGSSPIYIVSDVDFLEQVFIKQFSNFYRHATDVTEHTVTKSKRGLLIASGNQWRRQKQIVGSIISTGMKQMNSLFDKCINDMLVTLETSTNTDNEEFNIYPLYKATFWNMACGTFGIDTSMEKEATDELFDTFEKFFTTNANDYTLLRAVEMFPSFDTILLRLFELYNGVGQFISRIIWRIFRNMMFEGYALYRVKQQLLSLFEKRWKNSNYWRTVQTQTTDFLAMMSVMLTFDPITDEKDTVEGKSEQQQQQRLIGPHEIVDNAFAFMGAQYVGNAAIMACSSHILATHRDVQKKLLEEIDHFLPPINQKQIDGDVVAKMPYLDMFIREILRMYPISTLGIERRCMKDTIVQGLHVTKGSVIQADVYSIHFDPDLWGPEDPKSFCPERHSTTRRHAMALLFFGAGPRMCPGVRLALTTAKMLLVRLLQKYTIESSQNQEALLDFKEKVIQLPTDAWIKLVVRK
ncbi:unnamed protein product [Adineta ricciae]|uniref:Cytochrome P450 n=1 Tax=Adineta ricciae TaxID=249248 RepID=A0A814T6R8_ADIRI|nr:unnamed protein product [Adineta ricciae]CAF1195589.1 unnamed protein product [Adineta ricciae]